MNLSSALRVGVQLQSVEVPCETYAERTGRVCEVYLVRMRFSSPEINSVDEADVHGEWKVHTRLEKILEFVNMLQSAEHSLHNMIDRSFQPKQVIFSQHLTAVNPVMGYLALRVASLGSLRYLVSQAFQRSAPLR